MYGSTDPEAVLTSFFDQRPRDERERLLRRCYRTGEQFAQQYEQQELTLAHIYSYGVRTCSIQQLHITPSSAVAELIKDRRHQLYSSIQRRPGWRQFPYNTIPANIWRYRNRKRYLGQELLRLYVKLADRTPEFASALALLTREYHSGGRKRLTKTVLGKIIDELPTSVPDTYTISNSGPATVEASGQRAADGHPQHPSSSHLHPPIATSAWRTIMGFFISTLGRARYLTKSTTYIGQNSSSAHRSPNHNQDFFSTILFSHHYRTRRQRPKF